MITMALFFGCEESAINPELQNRGNSGNDDISLMGNNNAKSAMVSETSVLKFSDLSEVGTSRLLRNDNGVSFNINTTNLEPGTAVTLWMVIFNKPENCTDGMCNEDDVFDASARAAAMVDVVFSGSGRVIQNSGKANFAGHRNEGDNSDSIIPVFFGEMAFGLKDARKAEIHFVIRSHGPLIPGLINEQISTFSAGCAGFPPELGTPGPNNCQDLQFSVHMPH